MPTLPTLPLFELIPSVLLLGNSLALIGLTAYISTKSNISEHIQHAAIGILICAILTPILLIANILKPALKKSIILFVILTFIWMGSAAIAIAASKYVEKNTKMLWISTIGFVASQLLSCSSLWFSIRLKLKQQNEFIQMKDIPQSESAIDLNGNLKEGTSLASVHTRK